MSKADELVAKELAEAIERCVGSVSRSPEEFLQTMRRIHETHQQDFTRLCMVWMKWLAEAPDTEFDARNMASRELAQRIIKQVDYFGLPRV